MMATLFDESLDVRLAGERITWVGAISFEERCIGSATQLSALGADVSLAVLLNYPTTIVAPRGEDERRRRHHRERILALFADSVATSVVDVDPYSPAVAYAFLDDTTLSDQETTVVVDVTCLTRSHVLGLAATMASDQQLLERTVFAYTSPRRYGALRAASPGGWRETLVLPLVPGARLGNAGPARGVVILGHEADRLAVALSEFEPEGGTVVVVDWPGRPDFGRMARSNNRTLLEYWRVMGRNRWREVDLGIADAGGFYPLVQTEAATARAESAPVVLYPYGPKVSCLAAALCLAGDYPDRGWFAYPVPRAYDIDHSYGVGRTRWFDGTWTSLAVSK